MWSVRLVALGTTLVAVFTELPDVATNLWLVLPADLKSALPVEFGRYLGYAILALGLVARIVRQRKLVERKAEMGGESYPCLPIPPQADSGRVADGSGLDDVVHGIRERRDV